jgi:membrane protein implicated in regulation of membrane protease activity
MAADTGDRPRWPYLLLIIPFVALLWVPFYNSIEPSLWGIPFFYWYQFLWVPLTTLLIVWVHRQTADHSANAEAGNAEEGGL